MIETTTIFLTSVFANLFTIGLLVLFAIFTERDDERGWSFFWSLLASATAFVFFDLKLTDIAWYAVGYLVIGIVWTFFRYKRFLTKKIKSIKEYVSSFSGGRSDVEKQPEIDSRIALLSPDHMLGTITHWALIWPVSMIANLTGDTIDAIKNIVGTAFKGVYSRIYKSAIGEL